MGVAENPAEAREMPGGHGERHGDPRGMVIMTRGMVTITRGMVFITRGMIIMTRGVRDPLKPRVLAPVEGVSEFQSCFQ